MNAEQYRALVNRLEAINEADESFPSLKIGDIDPRNGKKILSAMTSSDGTVVRSRFGDIWNVKYGEPDAPAPVKDEPKPEEPAPATEPVKDEPKPEPVKPDEPAPAPAPEEKCGPEVKEKIKQQKTFNAAYAMAKAAECPEFDWCQIVRVPGQGPSPTPPGGTIPYGMANPGDRKYDVRDNAAGRAQAGLASMIEDEELEESAYVAGDVELDRIREIAGTQVLEGGWIPGTPKYDPQRIGDIDPNTGKPDFRKPAQDTSQPTKEIPEIKASSKAAAIEIARKKGIKVFKFCGKYKVQDAKRQAPSPTPPGPKPKPKPKPQQDFITSNPMGDFDPTAFSGQAAAPRPPKR